MKIGKPQLMREINMKQVREILQVNKSLTKPELAKLSGLSVVTINALVTKLVNQGEVYQLTESSMTGGRPASRFSYNFDYQYVLAICLYQKEVTDVADFTVCNLAGEVKAHWSVEFQQVTKETISELIQSAKKEYSAIQQVAIGMPGVEIAGKINMSDFVLMKDVFLRSYLMETCQLPVIIENDVNSVLLGHCHTQRLQGETVVALYYPDNYPPGSAVYLNDQIVHGVNGLVGEINLLPLSVHWHQVAEEEGDLTMNICQTIITMMIAYDPHRIVIYGKRPQAAMLPVIEHQLTDLFGQVSVPKIAFLQSFNTDYLAGVKSLAIQVLENKFHSEESR